MRASGNLVVFLAADTKNYDLLNSATVKNYVQNKIAVLTSYNSLKLQFCDCGLLSLAELHRSGGRRKTIVEIVACVRLPASCGDTP